MPDHEPACTGTYTCTRCGVAKPALAFAPNKQKVNGLDSWCRECGNETRKKTPAGKKKAREATKRARRERYYIDPLGGG